MYKENTLKLRNFKTRQTALMYQLKITPEKAEQLLNLNYEGQRKLVNDRVAIYAKDMASGLWNESVRTDPIAVSCLKDGTIISLLNGQHRLRAVIKSGCTVYMWFIEEYPENYKDIDNGLSRKVNDYVDFRNKNGVLALMNIIRAYYTGTSSLPSVFGYKSSRYSRSETLAFINDHEDEWDLWLECVNIGQRIYRALGYGPQAAYSAFAYFVKKMGRDDQLDEFVADLFSCKHDSTRLLIRYFADCKSNKVTFRGYTAFAAVFWAYDNFKGTRYKYFPKAKMDSLITYYGEYISKMKKEEAK